MVAYLSGDRSVRLLRGKDEFISIHGESELTKLVCFDPWRDLA